VVQFDVLVDARESSAASVNPGAVQILLHQDLRDVVADLGTHHRERVTGDRMPCETSSQFEAWVGPLQRGEQPPAEVRDRSAAGADVAGEAGGG
jgi:hypothetical protein